MGRACCLFTVILFFEAAAWLLAAIAIATSYWLEPARSTMLAASHSGLWRTCFRASSEMGSAAPAPSGSATYASGATALNVSGVISNIKDDLSRLRPGSLEEPGCTNDTPSYYKNLRGQDYSLPLQITRAFAIAFLALGLLKALFAMFSLCCGRRDAYMADDDADAGTLTKHQSMTRDGPIKKRRRRCTNASGLVSHLQAICGIVAFALFLSIIIRMSREHRTSGGQRFAAADVRLFWGWSFWLFFASVCSSLWASLVLLCC